MKADEIEQFAERMASRGFKVEVVGRFCEACGFVLTDRGDLHRSPVAREYPCEPCLNKPLAHAATEGVER